MLMAVNIGNSRISVGIFDGTTKILLAKLRVYADRQKSSDEYANLFLSMLRERGVEREQIENGILSSVVPQLTDTVKEAVSFLVGEEPLIVGPGVKTGFPIRIDNPSELGGDIVADVAAAITAIKQDRGTMTPAIVAHVGTVTTVSAVNGRGEFVGCSIFPGVRLSFEAMHGKTALLPSVSLSAPRQSVAKNSLDAVRSGVIFGHAMMLDGFAERFAREMGCDPRDLACFVTGKDARYVTDSCKRSFVFDEDLTLKGLCSLFCNAK